jgi:sugar phosphate isomerase/epimerase
MITRRKFMLQSAAITAALMVDTSGLFKMRKVLGIQLYTVRDEVDKDLVNTLKQVAGAGYTHVELYGYKDRKFFGRSVQEMSDLLKANNLETPSGHYGLADMLYSNNYNWDSWKYLLEDAHTLGHKFVTIPYIEATNRTVDDFKRITERLNKGGEISKDAGLVTAYHNHDFEFKETGGIVPLEYMLANTEEKLVKFEMDLYWAKYAGQDPAAWFKKYPHRFCMWHIKDMEAATAGKDKGQTCEVGKGVIDWKEIFEHKKKAGLEYAFVEQEQYRRPVFECIRTSADYMKKNLLK